MKQAKANYLRYWMVFSVTAGLLAAVFSASPTGRWLEQTLVLDLIFEIRGVRAPPEDVVVVSMDRAGADLPTAGSGNRLWSRNLYSSLINRLTDANATGIVMDVTFEAARDETDDKALEASLAKSGRVVMFQRLGRIDNADIPVAVLPRFASVARASAVFPLPKVSRIDSYWPFFRFLETTDDVTRYRELPSLPVAALQLRLLDEIGIEPFERFLDADLRNMKGGFIAGKSSRTDLSWLMSTLRARLVASNISENAVSSLLPDDTEKRSSVKRMLNSLMQVYLANGLRPLNFYGPPRTINTIDHMSIMGKASTDKTSLDDDIAGKMVFIGHSSKTAIDQEDGFRTVYSEDGLDLSGVEIAATAYANLVDGSSLRRLSISQTILIHVIFAIVAVYIALRASLLKAVMFAFVLAAGYMASAIFFFVVVYSLLPVSVPLLLLLPITVFIVLLVRYFGANRQAGFYRHGIRTLLPVRVVADIESGHLEQAAHQCLNGICMMTDIANFTHYTEVQGHECMGNLSREYFSMVMGEIQSSGGELFDVEGDGLTAFWDQSAIDLHSKDCAADAALSITHNVGLFNARHPRTPFDTRIGLDSGTVEATYIGGKANRRFCLVGDVANTSSRLEALNKRLGTWILASKAVVQNAETLLIRPVGIFLLKGKSTELEVFEVMNLKHVATVKEQTLCARFTEAMERISNKQFDKAEKILVDILRDYGPDGPACFFLQLLNNQNDPDVYLEPRGVVQLNAK